MAETISMEALRLRCAPGVQAFSSAKRQLRVQVSVPQASQPTTTLTVSASASHASIHSDWPRPSRPMAAKHRCELCSKVQRHKERQLPSRWRGVGGHAPGARVHAVTLDVSMGQANSMQKESSTRGFGKKQEAAGGGKGKEAVVEEAMPILGELYARAEQGDMGAQFHLDNIQKAMDKDEQLLRGGGMTTVRSDLSDPLEEWLEGVKMHDPDRREWARDLQQHKREIEELRRELAELLEEMGAMLESGDTAGVLALADANLAAVEEQRLDGGLGGGMEQALMLEMLAQVYCCAGQLGKGEKVLDQAAGIVDGVEADSQLLVGAELLHQMADLYSQLQRPQDAVRFFELCLTVQERLGVPAVFLAPTIQSLGLLYQSLGKVQEATGIQRHFLARMEREPENPHLQAQVLTNLAMLIHSGGGGSFQEAEEALTEAVELSAECFGPSSSEVAGRWALLAGVKNELGKASEAEELLERAIPILRRSQVAEAEEGYRNGQFELSAAKLALGKEDEALELLDGQLEHSEATLGAGNPALVLPLMAMAHIHMGAQRFALAVPLLARSLELLRGGNLGESLEVSNPLQMLAWCHLYMGQLAEAEAAANEHLAWAKRVLGEEQPHQLLASSYFALGTVMIAQERWRKAEPLFYRAVGTIEALAGPDSPHLIQPIECLLEVLEKLNRGRSVAKYRMQLQQLKKAESETDRSTNVGGRNDQALGLSGPF